MIQELEKIESIAKRNGFESHAKFVRSLLESYRNDEGHAWSLINTNEVWGGAGSLVDISLSSYSKQSEEEIKKDEYEWRRAFISIFEEMESNGISNSRAEHAANTFRYWNEHKIGI